MKAESTPEPEDFQGQCWFQLHLHSSPNMEKDLASRNSHAI